MPFDRPNTDFSSLDAIDFFVGDSVPDISESMGEIAKQLGDLSDEIVSLQETFKNLKGEPEGFKMAKYKRDRAQRRRKKRKRGGPR